MKWWEIILMIYLVPVLPLSIVYLISAYFDERLTINPKKIREDFTIVGTILIYPILLILMIPICLIYGIVKLLVGKHLDNWV